MDWLMLAGLCLAAAGLAFSLWQHLRAAVTFACGLFAGRLHLRRQQQQEIVGEGAADGEGRGGADEGARGQ